MARDDTDETDKSPVAAQEFGGDEAAGLKLKWKRYLIAEDEITRREVQRATLETPEQWEWAAKASTREDFWPTIRAYADECDEILAEHDFPPAFVNIVHDGAGHWRLITDADRTPPKPGETRRFMMGAHLTKAHAPGFSDAWYAAEIGLKCRLALEALPGAAGRPNHYAALFEIASLRTEWQWRRGHKASILTGRKQRKVLAEHRGAANDTKKCKVEKRRAAIAHLLSGTRLEAGALEQHLLKRLCQDCGISVSRRTIRRDLDAIRGA